MGRDFPDGHKLSIIRGLWGTEYKSIKVTEDGEMYILLSALFGTTVTALKCDSSGNAFLNVKAQDLAEVINRPKYGAGQSSKGTIGTSPTGTHTAVTISAKGIIYGGVIYVDETESHKTDYPVLSTEHGELDYFTLEEMYTRQMFSPGTSPFWLLLYDEINYNYCVGIQPGITFETELEVGFRSAVAGGVGASYYLMYALV